MNRRIILKYISIVVILFVAITISILFSNKNVFYSVIFKDYDGTVLKKESIEEGKPAKAPVDPQRDGYIFIGWNRDFSSIDKDTVIIAEYLKITDSSFKVDTVKAVDNKNVTIKISVSNNPGILGMTLSLNYDEEALKLIACQNGRALSALAFQEPSRYVNGCKFVWYGSTTGEVKDGEILILTFEVTENTKTGIYPISVSWNKRDIYDSNCDMLDPNVTQGAIVVSE